jgi:hypothetical protein
MPLAGDILPALPNGDQRWREQQRSVGRLERNRREKRVGVRVPTSAAQQRSTPRRRDRGRAQPRRAVVRVLVRADAKPERRRPRASTHAGPAPRRAAPRKAHAKAHAKAEEAAAPAPLALNRPPARAARSRHSAVELNGPAVDLDSTAVLSFQRTRRPSQEGRFVFAPMPVRPRRFDRAVPLGLTLLGSWSRNHARSALWLGPFVSSLATRARTRASARETRQARRETLRRCPAASAYSPHRKVRFALMLASRSAVMHGPGGQWNLSRQDRVQRREHPFRRDVASELAPAQ